MSEVLLSFLKLVSDYYRYSTDAPPQYGEAVGIVQLGHALGWDAVHLIKPYALHHNIYLLLVGESTFARKSTCQTLGEKFYPKERSMFLDRPSPERFIVELSKMPEMMLYLGEFPTYLKAINRSSYLSEMVEVLNDLHGCPPEWRRVTMKGEWKVTKPYLSIISTTTPEMLKKHLTEELVEGGFMPRWLLVHGEADPKPRGWLTPDVLKLHRNLILCLEAITRMNREIYFVFTPEALRRYNEIEEEVRNNYKEAKAIPGRYLDYVISIADIIFTSDIIGILLEEEKNPYEIKSLKEMFTLAGAETQNNNVPIPQEFQGKTVLVPREYVDRAWKVVRPCLDYARDIVDFVLYDEPIAKVRECIKKHKQISHSEVMRLTHMSSDKMPIAIDTLRESGEIEIRTQPFTGPKGDPRTKIIYVWTGQ